MRTLLGLAFALILSSGCIPVTNFEPKEMPPSDNRMTALGLQCDADLAITGSFVQEVAKPVEIEGCWPVGTWTFKASAVANRCPDAPTFENEYKFRVTRDAEDNESYEYLTNPAYERIRIKVTSGGSGLCEGGVTIWSLDGKTIWNMKPNLHADNHLDGQGEYEIYGEDQY
jgi:hypothetical protein